MVTMPNRDFVSTTMFDRNQNKLHYNAFIFGSSRTVGYKTTTWNKYLPASAKPFVFDAFVESIFGIYTKVSYVDKSGADLKYCLVIIDPDCTFFRETGEQHKGHMHMKHPKVAGTSWFNFYATSLKDYFDFNFLKSYLTFEVSKKYSSSMEGYILDESIKYDTVTNDVWRVQREQEILKNKKKYYVDKKDVFYDRDSLLKFTDPKISSTQKEMLRQMKKIFVKHNTQFKIIISPLYDQKKLNIADLKILQNIFGSETVNDFSGINNITSSKEYYYESSHYRPVAGDTILNIIYSTDQEKASLISFKN